MASIGALVRRIEKQREFWDTIPNGSVAMFLALVFCLFAVIGVISQLQAPEPSLGRFWAAPVLTGVLAVGYAWSAVRRKWLVLVALLPTQIAVVSLVGHLQRRSSGAVALSDNVHRWLLASSISAMICLTVGFALLMTFIRREGERFARTYAEMQLAGEIHKSLVPTIERRIGDYEFYATSRPSGMVGGDLVDVIARAESWLAYVADVSGHGVSSGVLMAMIKSATQMGMQGHPGPDGLLEGINRVLCSLKATNQFATFAFVAYTPEDGLRYSLAGHLPALRWRNKDIELQTAENLPLGVFPDAVFDTLTLNMRKDDVLAIVTDGLTEVFDKGGAELGFPAISAVLRDAGDRPLPDIASAIFARVSEHGPRSDDQSLLLIRQTA